MRHSIGTSLHFPTPRSLSGESIQITPFETNRSLYPRRREGTRRCNYSYPRRFIGSTKSLFTSGLSRPQAWSETRDQVIGEDLGNPYIFGWHGERHIRRDGTLLRGHV